MANWKPKWLPTVTVSSLRAAPECSSDAHVSSQLPSLLSASPGERSQPHPPCRLCAGDWWHARQASGAQNSGFWLGLASPGAARRASARRPVPAPGIPACLARLPCPRQRGPSGCLRRPVMTTAAGTSGCRVRMVTRAASGAVITWRHDGIGTRRFHRPPPFQARRHGNGELSHNHA